MKLTLLISGSSSGTAPRRSCEDRRRDRSPGRYVALPRRSARCRYGNRYSGIRCIVPRTVECPVASRRIDRGSRVGDRPRRAGPAITRPIPDVGSEPAPVSDRRRYDEPGRIDVIRFRTETSRVRRAGLAPSGGETARRERPTGTYSGGRFDIVNPASAERTDGPPSERPGTVHAGTDSGVE